MGFLLPMNVDSTMGSTGVKKRFRVKDNAIIHVSWKDDEDWTEIHSEREWKKMMDGTYEILALKDNGVYDSVW